MGGLIQLAAYGNADVFLTGNPQITFWKMVFKRYTNFAIESIEQPFTGTPNFGTISSVTLPKNTADLIHKCHIQVQLKKTNNDSSLKDQFGLKLLKRVIVSIDGMDIDAQTGEWMSYWNEYTMEDEKKDGYNEMIGNSTTLFGTVEEDDDCTTVIIPLMFYFCKTPGLSLPIHALQYSEVKVRVEFNEKVHCITGSNISIEKCSLFVDYVFLDVEEKKQILQGAQEFLITQTQELSGKISDSTAHEGNVKLDFIHPIKELIWAFQGSDGSMKHMTSAHLTMNGGQKRASERPAKYFRLVQPYDHHSKIPTLPLYMYSFALKPEEAQPSGTCNYSRLDNSYLYYKLKSNHGASRIKVFATNTNLLRIMSGKGALAYS